MLTENDRKSIENNIERAQRKLESALDFVYCQSDKSAAKCVDDARGFLAAAGDRLDGLMEQA